MSSKEINENDNVNMSSNDAESKEIKTNTNENDDNNEDNNEDVYINENNEDLKNEQEIEEQEHDRDQEQYEQDQDDNEQGEQEQDYEQEKEQNTEHEHIESNNDGKDNENLENPENSEKKGFESINQNEEDINIEAKNESYYNHLKELTDEDITSLYAWLDSIKFSRKINPITISRDFSDGILYAEILKHYFPKFVDLHNYIPTLNAKQKRVNWETINHKILRKISLEFKPSAIQKIINLESGFIEKHLFNLKDRVS